MKRILKCTSCNTYTLQETHCETATIQPKPPKFSLDDKYAQYRRETKKADLEKRNLI